MYSPYASPGSISLVIRVSWPAASKVVFISSSASGLRVSTASSTPGPRSASRVFSMLTGCTVSPLTSRTPRENQSRASQREYALFHSSALSLGTRVIVTPYRRSSSAWRSRTASAA